MRSRLLALFLGALLVASCTDSRRPAASPEQQPSTPAAEAGLRRTEMNLANRFEGFDGCFVLYNMKDGSWIVHNPTRADSAFSPCSTFKIFNSLAGLQAGVLKDETTTFRWDSTSQPFPGWEQDHTLASAVKNSVVWYFRKVAAGVGEQRMQGYLDSVGYGNRDISSGLTNFWLYPNSLKVTANDQAKFLDRLYRNDLPFDRRAMEIARRVILLRDSAGVKFSGKTGTGLDRSRDTAAIVLGWFVGHVAGPKGEYVFATNIRGADSAWGTRARGITESILDSLGLMPRAEPAR